MRDKLTALPKRWRSADFAIETISDERLYQEICADELESALSADPPQLTVEQTCLRTMRQVERILNSPDGVNKLQNWLNRALALSRVPDEVELEYPVPYPGAEGHGEAQPAAPTPSAHEGPDHAFFAVLRKQHKSTVEMAMLAGVCRISVEKGFSHLTPDQCFDRLVQQWEASQTEEAQTNRTEPAPTPQLGGDNSLGIPPFCGRHQEEMVLSMWDRPGGPPGNGWSCRSCIKERKPVEPQLGTCDYVPHFGIFHTHSLLCVYWKPVEAPAPASENCECDESVGFLCYKHAKEANAYKGLDPVQAIIDGIADPRSKIEFRDDIRIHDELVAAALQAQVNALREALQPFQYMRWKEVERVAHVHCTVLLTTEGSASTELGHINAEDLLRVRAALQPLPAEPPKEAE